MEDLLTLFAKVQQTSTLPVLEQETVLVQNPGMQHWLNMQQAQIMGISMNAKFVLPAQFLWQQLRTLCGEAVPEQYPYSREVLAWRIDNLLQNEQVTSNDDCAQATNYWCKNGKIDPLKRFQLAVQLADLYEQYLIYRPKWIDAWAKGNCVADFDQHANEQAKWQGYIWYLLQQESAYNPLELFKTASANIETYKHLLPKRVSIFGINALAPMWVDFLTSLSHVIDVHFYHLNPCYEYWADIKTDKVKAKQGYLSQIDKWPEDAVQDDSANPLLANLGQQGREFLSLLHNAPNIEIPIFDELFGDQALQSDATSAKPSALKQIQKDILTLSDKRLSPSKYVDDSITITSAHSALREVQGLHDYLLHQFNNDPSLTPKDVLVMCPQIEQYAPYIDSVFVRGWENIGESIPPLPCSIADRVSKDSEPLVAAFSELLSLPDSRFSVSQILGFLRLLPLQMRFGLNESDIELISDWLDKANIHWGIDSEHKDKVLNSTSSNSQFTWQQGLDRLLHGFAYGDELSIVNDDLMLPWVEGSNAIVLGKVLLLCEQLKLMNASFNTAKTAKQWQQSLQKFIEQLFLDKDGDNGLVIINHAIESLALYCSQAGYEEEIELAVIREYLNSHFSQPDPGRQFMIGQITFCSMLPMRSIPFKVLAVMGLNDGEFPRQRQPLGFDLMSMTSLQPGDRSRRGDDRYLFLEALISARDSLYLSYQGNDIRNNNERQPSIVLRELMDYLANAYQWDFSKEHDNSQLRQLPLQVFSADNFTQQNPYQSFDKKWLDLGRLSKDGVPDETSIKALDVPAEQLLNVSLADLNRFLTNPAQVFAQQRLKLFFNKDDEKLTDVEPFTFNHLDKYLFQQQVFEHELQSQAQTKQGVEALSQQTLAQQTFAQQAMLSGDFPDTPVFADTLAKWQAGMANFSNAVINQKTVYLSQLGLTEQELCVLEQDIVQHQQISVDLPTSSADNQPQTWLIDSNLSLYKHQQQIMQFSARNASVKAKDLTSLYLNHLLACSLYPQGFEITSVGFYVSEGNDKKAAKLQTVSFNFIDDAKAKLQAILMAYQANLLAPKLVNSTIAHTMLWKFSRGVGKYIDNDISQAEFTKMWQSTQYTPGLDTDPYLDYFWPQCPPIAEHTLHLRSLYQGLYQNLTMSEQDLDIFASSMSANSEEATDDC